MKPVQYFNTEYLLQSGKASPAQILQFLEQFRLMQAPQSPNLTKSKLISMKVPEDMLATFRAKCEVEGIKYQTQIKVLMDGWLKGR